MQQHSSLLLTSSPITHTSLRHTNVHSHLGVASLSLSNPCCVSGLLLSQTSRRPYTNTGALPTCLPLKSQVKWMSPGWGHYCDCHVKVRRDYFASSYSKHTGGLGARFFCLYLSLSPTITLTPIASFSCLRGDLSRQEGRGRRWRKCELVNKFSFFFSPPYPEIKEIYVSCMFKASTCTMTIWPSAGSFRNAADTARGYNQKSTLITSTRREAGKRPEREE